LNKQYLIISICFLITNFINAQDQNINFTNSKLDKVVLKEMQIDTLVWYFEDFKESIVIDSSWQ
jgi:predicted RND superfamily exporter protein